MSAQGDRDFRTAREQEAGKMPAPQDHSPVDKRAAKEERVNGISAPQDHDPNAQEHCGAGFQPADSFALSFPREERTEKTPHQIIRESEPPLTAGSCLLKEPRLASIVHDALLHFEGERYFLSAWCVMPNHVHLVVTPLHERDLSDILHSWKSFTANQINRVQERTGPLWERESCNHMIRSEEHLQRFVQYVEDNPVQAKLCGKAKEWPFGSCGAGFQPAPEVRLVDPRGLPFAPAKSRGELPHIIKEGATYFVTFRLLDAVVLNPKRAG